MSDLEYWTAALRKAEQELDAPTTRTAINAALKRYMLAKKELKRLQQNQCSPVPESFTAPAGSPFRSL